MKRGTFLMLFLAVTGSIWGQQISYQLSSHILDITQGAPASGVSIRLSKMESSGEWTVVEEKLTNDNGRINDFLQKVEGKDSRGVYKFTYFTQPYFERQGQTSFYPFIEVIFEIKDDSHYHVPITLSPFGYSTYRGS